MVITPLLPQVLSGPMRYPRQYVGGAGIFFKSLDIECDPWKHGRHVKPGCSLKTHQPAHGYVEPGDITKLNQPPKPPFYLWALLLEIHNIQSSLRLPLLPKTKSM